MFNEKIAILKEMNEKLKLYIQQRECTEIQTQVQKMCEIINEIFASENEFGMQMKLIGMAKTLEDALNALANEDFDTVELYIVVHMPALLEDIESTKEKEMLMEAFRNVQESLVEIEKNMQKKLVEVKESTKREYQRLIGEEVVTLENFISKYENSEDEEIREIVDYVRKNQRLEIFNYEYIKNYDSRKIEVFFDKEAEMNYIMFMGKRMYFPSQFPKEDIALYVNGILIEQDKKSPHCYEKEGFLVQNGDVVIDAGVAEGNFALSVIDKVKKIYLVECEEAWITALKKTFEPYGDKVVFVKKFLSNKVDDNNITIDALAKDEEVNYIKMDIEGAERAALQGAADTIKRNSRLTMAVCAYHERNDEAWIKSYLDDYGLQIENSHGYMYFIYDERALLSLELRRGVVFGKK